MSGVVFEQRVSALLDEAGDPGCHLGRRLTAAREALGLLERAQVRAMGPDGQEQAERHLAALVALLGDRGRPLAARLSAARRVLASLGPEEGA